ncbi:MAG TPA: glutamine-hydrolyzing carbamoyl-phosphate synthase small subunit [bacterium]|nr:glutamine-hydrolyzing carbamoyl-phosphate synthase small subunit [Candidatus Omnitrophota bacterium]HOJ58992.1 glutamine-hydrolyzing carbamoyl-phosphate synthase small subunit [bacterium]HOL95872.1 glutamine-hydrolyzing carbamoyl-phosphate synthase small subunit [bacterium]
MSLSILNRPSRPPAVLVLEDGSLYRGRAFGAVGETGGEVVFNTAMAGYQEVLTDPSYHGQIVTMTYPLIGNYGANEEDVESNKIQVAGFIIKEPSAIASNWRSRFTLEDWMKQHNTVGLCGIDTRALVRKLRNFGVMRGVICPAEGSEDDWRAKVESVPFMAGSDLARFVTTDQPYRWNDPLHPSHKPRGWPEPHRAPVRVVAIDYGIKQNILRHLAERVSETYVLPATATAADVWSYKPDGVFLSNGPGDPEPVTYAIHTVRELLGKIPIFGICLGHQILGLALGCKTYKLKFGHRGANQPVKDLATGKIDITSQNHGFCVDMADVDSTRVRVTHINLNDHTVEGLECRELNCFSVQYHPEASPGPHDATHHFDTFVKRMTEERK